MSRNGGRNDDKYKLWQHGNGTYYVSWTERIGSRAQTKRVSAGTEDRLAAEQFRAQFIAGLGNPATTTEPTIGELLDRYRNEHGVNTRSIGTIDYHLRTLKKFFGLLQPIHVSNNLLKDYSKERAVSAGTILRELEP